SWADDPGRTMAAQPQMTPRGAGFIPRAVGLPGAWLRMPEASRLLDGPALFLQAQIRAGHAFDLGDGIVTEVSRFMSFADGFLVRPAHKAEGFSLLEVDVRRMRKHGE